ncbi:MAG TPA: zf-HC2 domain-containing protein [Dehalococcoidia bacterium]
MTCADLRPLISAYVDGSVSGREAGLVGAHLETCAACRALADAYETVAEQLQRLRREDRMPSVVEGVLDTLGAPRRRPLVTPVSVGAGVAATTIILATGALILNQRHRRRRAAGALPGVALPS